MAAVRDKNSRREKEPEYTVEPPPPPKMVFCACGCPNHPQAVRCMACSRTLPSPA